MARFHVLLMMALATIWLFPNQAFAQGVISFVDGTYPKTGGTQPKSIAVKGSVAPDKGWTLKEVRMEAWEEGKDVGYYIIPFKDNKWPSDGTWSIWEQKMPKASTDYWVLVTARMNDGVDDRIIRTLAKVVKSKTDP